MTTQFDLFTGPAASNPQQVPDVQQWNDPRLTVTEARVALNRALEHLPLVPGSIRPLFKAGITSMFNEIEAVTQYCQYHPDNRIFTGKAFFRSNRPVIAETTLDQLGTLPDLEIKCHSDFFLPTEIAIYLSGVGTVEIRHWHNYEDFHIYYAPYRTTALLTSYRDDRPHIALPRAVWEHTCNAQKLAMSDNKIVEVQTFGYGGREYVVTSTHSCTEYTEGSAWSVVPRSSWNHPAYTYRELRHAWDAGEIERGNDCGQLVRVRGQVCVLEAMSIFHDTRVPKSKAPDQVDAFIV